MSQICIVNLFRMNLQLCPRMVCDAAGPGRHPVELFVVKNDGAPVGTRLYIGFEMVDTGVQGS